MEGGRKVEKGRVSRHVFPLIFDPLTSWEKKEGMRKKEGEALHVLRLTDSFTVTATANVATDTQTRQLFDAALLCIKGARRKDQHLL